MRTKTCLPMSLMCLLLCAFPAGAATIYVDADAAGKNDGRTWSDAYTSLSRAIEAASVGDEIWVAEGRYRPIELKNGVRIFGGFAGGETSPSSSDPDVHRTYIDGAGDSRAVVSINNDSSTVVRGFYIVNGNAPSVPETGGGAYLEDSSVTFARCVFANNTAWFAGGAVANHVGGSPTFVNCRFHSNGGGDGRLWPVGGGAFYNHHSAGAPTFVTCLFDGNAASAGGAVLALRNDARFVNCTFANNRAMHGKGGALFYAGSGAVMQNCILSNNVAKQSSTNEIYSNGGMQASHSNVRGGWPGEGNIDANPLFVDPAAGDYRLQAKSACRDAGRSASSPSDVADIDWDLDTAEAPTKDLGMQARVSGSLIDMGAYEFVEP